MHPAASIIVFTTLSGAGFGLAAFLALGAVSGSPAVLGAAALTALGLAAAGLVSSTFHLGRPERAWRALTQWRTSWLSREGVLSIATLGLFAVQMATAVLLDRPLPLLGLVVAALSAVTVYATAMIYASLRAVPRWHTGLTPACYLLFSAAGGALLAASFRAFAEGNAGGLGWAALALLVLAWAAKALWWRRSDRRPLGAAGSTPETATRLGRFGRVRLLEPPHSTGNYLTREMVFRVGRKHAAKLRAIAVVLGGLAPALLVALGLAAGGWPWFAAAALVHLAGILAERWLFFAEAEHVVALYYGHGERAAPAALHAGVR
ncbi:dimethyl sulfoxide reductase anchor subunit family protein [Faunimonas sp. B44]|uniref:dimethyl sulfoxide reductase anchor subunit family protein n=1 Tax=Faunimonas sp. B44 TaxID=3461493 RepID=UPI0040447E03